MLAVVFTVVMIVPAGSSMAAPAAEQGAAPGSIGLRLVDDPAAGSSDPRAQIYIVDHLAPGAAIDRQIEFSNTTATTAHIVLYPAAAAVKNGSFLGSEGHTPNELSTWTSVGVPAADVPAGARMTDTVRIAVPTDAAAGERYGVVWAETRSAPVAGGGVTQVSRVGIRLYISVGPGGPPAANFTIGSPIARRTTDGRPMVLATVHNTGGRALDMSGALQLAGGPGGLSAGPFPATLGKTVAIGDNQIVHIVLNKALPAGPWDADITLRSGLLERHARAAITFPDAGLSPSANIASPLSRWMYPAITGVAALLLAVAALFIGRRRPRRRATGGAR